LNKTGEISVFGSNDYGQLGISNNYQEIDTPEPLNHIFPGNIDKITTGE
jgi:alpha-tubulin suppressor-like RCC1 family protein